MHVMNVDIETYSDVDITKTGAYAYAESPAFEILLIAYKIDDGPVEVIDVTKTLLTYGNHGSDSSLIRKAQRDCIENVFQCSGTAYKARII